MKKLLPLFLPLVFVGCSADSPIDDLIAGNEIAYQQEDSQKQQSLQYPPDLLSSGGAIAGTVSLSEYRLEDVPEIQLSDSLFAEIEGEERSDELGVPAIYRRDGRLRWVSATLPPEQAWVAMQVFWNSHLGFGLVKEDADIGAMETDWLDLRTKVDTPGVLGEYVDKFLKRVQDSGERDKFITRIEGNDRGGTDIYVSHRHVVAVFNREGYFSAFEPAENDVQLEIEMLRRIVLYLTRQDEGDGDLASQIAAAESGGVVKDYEFLQTTLWINKPFQDSWRLAQIGLDRGGFTVEDRDFQGGVIYIQHSGGPESEKIFGKVETGFLNKLFSDEPPVLRELLLKLREQGGRTEVTVEAAPGDSALTELQASVVLELLLEYLP